MENRRVFGKGCRLLTIILLNGSPYLSQATEHPEANNLLTSIHQQSRKISGSVIDATGLPVIGANVILKGTTSGTITDMDGRFTLEVPENAILEVSYIGFVTQEVTPGNKTSLQINLKEDSQKLDEVVVVGFGTQKFE